MKRTKVIIASVAVATLAMGCGIFAACGGDGGNGGTTGGGDPTYSVKFDANGGAYAEGATSVTLTTGTDGRLTELPPSNPTYAEHDFNGYNSKADGSGEAVSLDTEYSDNTATYYAQWVNIYNVTFNVGTDGALKTGESSTAKTTLGKLSALPEVEANSMKYFIGWYTTETTGGAEVDTDYVFSGDDTTVTLYARYGSEYTVTISAGTDGTIKDGVTTTYVTKKGKIDGYLPGDTDVECTKENWHFAGWADEGTLIDEREYVFEKNTELTAKYVQNNGLWNEDGSEMLAALTLNGGASDHTEYWFGADNKQDFDANTVITVYLDGKKQENFWLTGSCVDLSADVNNYGGVTTSSVKVTEDATFVVYIKLFPDGGTTFEFNGAAKKLAVTNTLPEGADAVVITVKNGETTVGTVTLYLYDKDGKALAASGMSDYYIYGWNGDPFGSWDTTVLSTTLETTYADFGKATYIKFHLKNTSLEPGPFIGVEVGGTYVLNMQDGTILEYQASGEVTE